MFWVAAAFLLLFCAAIVAIRMPLVQNWLVKEATQYLTRLTKHEVKVGYVSIAWLDELVIENVVVFDREKNEMIKVGSLRADFDLITLVSSAEPAITEIWLDSPSVSTINLKDSNRLNINELIDAIASLSSGSDTSSSQGPIVFHIDKIHLTNGSYTYSDLTEDSLPKGVFDYFHFTLHKINAEVNQLRIASDTFEINVRGLACEDVGTKLQVKELNTFYRYCSQSMQFHQLYAEIGRSTVKDYLEFRYDGNKDLKEFNDRVFIKAHLDSSSVYTDDLKLFAPSLNHLHELYTLSSDVSGRVVDISFRNLDMKYGAKSVMQGKISFTGFPKIDETFVNAKFTRFSSNFDDLEKYVGPQTEAILSKFGTISYAGSYTGFFTDFVAKGTFHTGLGDLDSDINIKIKDDEQHSEYEGKIRTSNFQLGKLMDRPDLLSILDMEGKIQGTGFSYSHAHLNLDASIHRIGVHGYSYKHIKVAANLMKGTFQGKATCADSNATFTLNGLLDFNQSPHFFDFSADVAYVNLQKLHVFELPITFSTKARMNVYGDNLDDFQGEASFAHTFFRNGQKAIAFDTLKVITEKVDGDRFVNFYSDLFEVNMDGDFTYSSLFRDLPRLINEYWLAIENKQEKIKKYYASSTPYGDEDYRVNFSFLLKKTNPIIGLFTQDFKLADNTKLNGTLGKVGRQASFNMVGICDRMQINEVSMSDCRLSYNSNKSLDHSFVSASGLFVSQRQRYSKNLKTDGLRLELVWNNEKMKIDANLDQQSNDNHLHSRFDLTLEEGNVDIVADKLDVKLLQAEWVGDSSHIIWTGKKLLVDNVKLTSERQELIAKGAVSENPEDELEILVNDFSLRPFGAIFEKDVEGTMNGTLVFGNLLSKNFKVDFDGDVYQLKVNKFLIGNILGQTDWIAEKEQFDVGFALSRDSVRTLYLTGFVKPFENNRLDIKANLDQFDLQAFEPFIGNYFSNLRGASTGSLSITGTLLNPNLVGKVHVEEGKFRFNFLKTSYSFSHDVTFDTSAIHFKELVLSDTNGNKCVANGQITHHRFEDFQFDLRAKFQNLLMLNTTEKDNSLFYGRVFGSGRIHITGPLEDIKVGIHAKNEANSKVYIPVNMSESLGGNEFISFVQKKKTQQALILDEEDTIVFKKEVIISQTSVEMDLDLDPDMEFELILDKQTGDVIRGTGSGNLKLNATTNGDFDVFGTYTFLNGRYNFTLLNLVSKKFDIRQGSTISWNGDPLLGILDIKAAIEERVSLKDILPETDTAWFNHPALRKRYPAYVNLFLRGNLVTPDISYKIQIKDYPLTITDSKLGSYQLDNYVRAFLQQLDVNEQQLSRQVFSLLVFRKFFPANSSGGGALAGQGAAGTVSSLLTSQLSSWVSQMDENLTIDIDLNGFNAQALDNLRVRLTYVPDILDKRIRITRDGTFANNQAKSSASSIAGDWSLEYMITRDGMLRLKMFTRNNYTSATSGLQNANQTSTGFSFMHTKSFDNLKELIQKKKAQEKLEEEFHPTPPVPTKPSSDTAQINRPKAVLTEPKGKEENKH